MKAFFRTLSIVGSKLVHCGSHRESKVGCISPSREEQPPDFLLRRRLPTAFKPTLKSAFAPLPTLLSQADGSRNRFEGYLQGLAEVSVAAICSRKNRVDLTDPGISFQLRYSTIALSRHPIAAAQLPRAALACAIPR